MFVSSLDYTFEDSSVFSMLCIQETKREAFDLAFIKTFCPKRFDKFCYVPSRGASGGLITIWIGSAFDGVVCFSDFFALGIIFTSKLSATSTYVP